MYAGAPAGAALQHLLVAAALVLAGGADLDLDPVHVGVGVDDQRPEPGADVQHHELRVTARGVVLVWHGC